jgi:hypothetical protein
LRCGLLCRDREAFAEVLQAAVDPELGELFMDAVLREAAAERAEIDAVYLLVVVRKRELSVAGQV